MSRSLLPINLHLLTLFVVNLNLLLLWEWAGSREAGNVPQAVTHTSAIRASLAKFVVCYHDIPANYWLVDGYTVSYRWITCAALGVLLASQV